MKRNNSIYDSKSNKDYGVVDEATSAYYSGLHHDQINRFNTAESPLSCIQHYLPQNGKALDIGSGSGRDLAWLYEHGLDARGTEPNDRMRNQAMISYPDLKDRIYSASLPDLSPCGDSYNLVT